MPGLSLRYPLDIVDQVALSTGMIFNDSLILSNISNEETREIAILKPQARMRPVTSVRKDMPVKISYKAQAVCNLEEFRTFYRENLGKSVKMDFESKTYYGYLTEFTELDEGDVSFSFTYTSRMEHLEEEPGLYSL